MPVHDWTRVEDSIFHHFHQRWISSISDALNSGVLPDEYYALAEQFASRFGPDVLTLQGPAEDDASELDGSTASGNGAGPLLAPPKVKLTDESGSEFYRRKQNAIAIRDISGDRIVAMVEIVSPGNKAGRKPFQAFIDKAAELLDRKIHLLILDLHSPSRRDPQGIHAAIWEEITGKEYQMPKDKPLTLVSYESAQTVRAYVEHAAGEDTLPDMPLFLAPGAHIDVPLETTYGLAFESVPRRWRRVLAPQ